MYYVYILKSRLDQKIYIGCTVDLKYRLAMHNNRKVAATQFRKPFRIIFCEIFNNKYDAYKREKWLKSGWGKNHIKKMLSNTLKNLDGLNKNNSPKISNEILASKGGIR